MPFIEDDGVKLWYEVTGSGQPIVLSGGFGLLHNQFDYVREMLAQEFQVIDWNYRGAGKSDRAWPGGVYNQDTWVNDLERVLAALDVGDAVLWGTSTGSLTTVRYTARFPARVKAMITFPMFKADAGLRRAFDGFAAIGETFGYEALAALTSWIGCSDENLFEPEHGRLARWEAECFRANFSIETLGQTMAIVAANDFTSELAKIRVPTLLLVGDSGQLGASSPGTRALIEQFMSHVPHATLTTIPQGGGTYCMVERPDETAAAVIDYVKSL